METDQRNISEQGVLKSQETHDLLSARAPVPCRSARCSFGHFCVCGVSYSALSMGARSGYGTAMHLQGDSPSSKWFSLQLQKPERRSDTSPGFESRGGGNFRYKPMPDTTLTTPKRNDRLAQLWNDLLADPVAPYPAAMHGRTVDARFDRNYMASLSLASDWERPSILNAPETNMTRRSYAVLEEAEQLEPVLLTGTDRAEPMSRSWRVELAKLFHYLFENVESAQPAADEAISEGEVFSDRSLEAAHAEILSLSSPFRWEPKPAWINAPVQSNLPISNMTDPRCFAARPKIPIRPLHKQPFYRRFFFYLRRWLSRNSRKIV